MQPKLTALPLPSTRSFLTIASAVAVALIGFAVISLAQRDYTQRLISVSQMVSHTHEVLAEQKTTVAQINAAESAVRGYLITSDGRFLITWRTSAAAATEHLQNLRRLTADNPSQQDRLRRLEPLLNDRLLKLEAVLSLFDGLGISSVGPFIIAGGGLELQQALLQGLSEVETEERALLARRTQEQGKLAARTAVVMTARKVSGLVFLVFFFVITYRSYRHSKSAESALRESESQFRDLANTIPQLCCIAHGDGSIFWYNQRWYDYTGSTAEQMEGWQWQSVHDPAVLPSVVERWNASIEGGVPFEMVFPLRAADGSFRDFLTRVVPVRSRDGAIVRWFGTNTDITEQRKVEEALRRNEERLSLVVEAGRLGTWDWDISRNELVWSARCLALFGLPAGYLMSYARFLECVHREDRGAVDTSMRNALANYRDYDATTRTQWPDGSIHWIAIRGRGYYDEAGCAVRMTGVALDVTERQEAEDRVRRLNAVLEERVLERTEQLEQANRELAAQNLTLREQGMLIDARNAELRAALEAKDRFLATMSHELRTPLNAILGFSGVLLMGLPGALNPEQLRQLESIRRGGKHLLSLISDLLDLARIGSGQVALTPEPVSLQSVVLEVHSTLRPVAEERGIELKVILPDAPCVIDIDRRSLLQILLNLAGNAIKFTERGEVRLMLDRRTSDGCPITRLSVQDTGVGIRPEDQGKLFQVFGRIENETRHEEGTGLGLHLSQKLATLLGGTIRVQSEFGRGSTFSLILPTPARVSR